LIERALVGRYAGLLGGDLDPAAVEATKANVGPRYQPIEVRQWNARRLPLPAASVSAVATNLPFGRQIGSAEENRTLYPALFAEFNRVLRPGGRLAFLAADDRLVQRTLAAYPRVLLQRRLPVLVRGCRAAIYVAGVAA
jgi:tRNA G10  N-methylase Trm11